MRTRMRLQRGLTLGLLLVMGGCFSYVPANLTPLERGERVRVHLRAPKEVRLTHITSNEVVSVQGEVIEQEDGQLLVSATQLASRSGFEHFASGETVRIDPENIAALEQRRFSWTRTALLSGVVALVVGVLWTSLDSGSGGVALPPGGGATQ